MASSQIWSQLYFPKSKLRSLSHQVFVFTCSDLNPETFFNAFFDLTVFFFRFYGFRPRTCSNSELTCEAMNLKEICYNPLGARLGRHTQEKERKQTSTSRLRCELTIPLLNVVVEWLTLLRIREVPGSYLGPGDLDWDFRGFPQSLQVNTGIVQKIRPWPLLIKSSPIQYHSLITLIIDATYSLLSGKRRKITNDPTAPAGQDLARSSPRTGCGDLLSLAGTTSRQWNSFVTLPRLDAERNCGMWTNLILKATRRHRLLTQ
jgi:hypothetical protein